MERETLEDDIISDNEMRLEDEGISDIPPEESQPHRPPKGKDTCKRSKVWDHFIAYTDGDGKPRAKWSYGKIGLPLKHDWVMVRKFVKVLQYFYDLTNRVSGLLYVTSNTFLDEISDVDDLLNEWINGDDVDLVDMARQMNAKFDKYWGNIEKMNIMLYVAVILDPRHKFFYLRYVFKNVHGPEIGEKMGDLAKSALYDVFEEYKKMYSSTTSRPSTTSSSESKLDSYLNEKIETDEPPSFSITEWWKLHTPRFPILARLARDVLAMPISTVASESAFSTGGRIIDDFRASLTPKMAQALIGCQD
ncbi:UNVERIFIED_CONTAM: putative AC transposase [Sesamum radiatum]|uniref:AC transposase n=1 Tax=Sesamum radiatum TaxID=300843 RepID=A0AAW2JNE9_SESRA